MNEGYNPSWFYISDLISYLEELKEEHGNLRLTREGIRGGVVYANLKENIKVAYVRPKEKRERTWAYRQGQVQDGDLKVLQI